MNCNVKYRNFTNFLSCQHYKLFKSFEVMKHSVSKNVILARKFKTKKSREKSHKKKNTKKIRKKSEKKMKKKKIRKNQKIEFSRQKLNNVNNAILTQSYLNIAISRFFFVISFILFMYFEHQVV